MRKYFCWIAILMIAMVTLSGCDEPVISINVYVDPSIAKLDTGPYPYCAGLGTEESPFDGLQCAVCWFVGSSYNQMNVYLNQEEEWVYEDMYTDRSFSKVFVDPGNGNDVTGDGTLTAPFKTSAPAENNAVIFILIADKFWVCDGIK